ncbi:MAG TPA: hypothetical protein VFO79_01780 [Xanthomonadales bacterium]|nr:hypothetical protein [Xanthomonadales bacterium]
MWRFALVLLVACKPGGVKNTDQLCAKATAMYAQCEQKEGMHPQEWELVIDRWRGLCRAVITGETKQLLPDGLQMYNEMPEEIRAALRAQAECTAQTTTCEQYRACEQ